MRYPTDVGAGRGRDAGCSRARRPQRGELAGASAPWRAGSLARGRAAAAQDQPHAGGDAPARASATALRLTGEAGELVERSVRETRRARRAAAPSARAAAAPRPSWPPRARLDELAERAEKVARQIRQRLAGEKITDRLVSITDPDARPIRKGKLGQPTEFGYVFQLAELSENTRRGARGLILPGRRARSAPPTRPTCCPRPPHELQRLGLQPARTSRSTAGFSAGVADRHPLPDPERVFIAGRQPPALDAPTAASRSYRVGIEGRISHLKRRYGTRPQHASKATTEREPGPPGRS